MNLTSVLEDKTKTLRFKVIRPVYETLTIKEVGPESLTRKSPVKSSRQVYELFRFLGQETKEHFITLHLDSKNRILAVERVSSGSMNANIVHPREVFKSCLLSSAVALICIHNHPSGVPDPSQEDYEITNRLKGTAEMLGIRLLDHVIIGEGAYVSFADRGLLDGPENEMPNIIMV